MNEKILPHLVLKAGGYANPNQGACVMNVAHMAMGAQRLADGRWSGVDITDLPECTHEAVARVAQRAWDAIEGENTPEHLAFLAKFLPRLMRAKRSENRRVSVRIALAAARSVEHLAPAEAKVCNDTVQAWLDGAATLDDVREARAASYASYAASAAYAAAYAAYAAYAAAYSAASDAYAAAYAAAYSYGAESLDMILDAHEKALAEEGEAVWDPASWEDDAIAFVDQLCAEIREELAGVGRG